MNHSDRIKQKAHALGFELFGIAPAKPVPDLDFFRWWLDQGYAGTMDYLRRGLEKRGDPERILSGVQSIICCGINYYNPQPPAPENTKVRISSYALGKDYHRIVGERLKRLSEFIEREIDPRAKTKVYVDTGPVLERSYAARAGLGWIGKNSCLIHNGSGSFFFLGEILSTLVLDYDQPVFDQCGTCTKCLDACPTQALPEPYVLDARRCISYLTIEKRGELPEEEERLVGNHLYGCDICQEVCPYNDRIPATPEAAFYPRELFIAPDLNELEKMTEEEFEKVRRGSAMERIRWREWRRNLETCRRNKGR